MALVVGLRKLPVLPQKLLEEMLPGVQRALFKIKRSGKEDAGIDRKFRAKCCALNPKLGDWEDIYNLERVRTGIDLKSYEVCATYHNIVVGVMPRGVKFFDRAP